MSRPSCKPDLIRAIIRLCRRGKRINQHSVAEEAARSLATVKKYWKDPEVQATIRQHYTRDSIETELFVHDLPGPIYLDFRAQHVETWRGNFWLLLN
ncbi:hypothetical protein [Cesiribacter andamanensis]|uniref:Transposase n=1 Tax=Cesiribacter andamanensis AMV16 TaxID=1279009 RepID=M7NB67_9BACT|nr:hypothetical protein [Cesiribacter andamanensis]EMR04446.1 hypothetical protein ADICEAN_00344 [Cesiribacter andamanensis AMV16]